MPKLILSMDGLVLKEIILNKERTSIGRKASNDIQIDNLAISGHHAVITCILNDAFLEDQSSTNGTYVNGQPIKKYVLQNNDVVELGKYRLKYLVDTGTPGLSPSEMVDTASLKPFEVSLDIQAEPPARPAPAPSAAGNPQRTQLIRQAATATAPAEQAEPSNNPGAERLGVIQVLNGANAGRELELSKSLTTLGKPGRQVAVITRRAHGYFITHVEGGNFPLVNGRALDAQAHRLNDHDIIELAGVKMEFFLRP
ncbi:FHA domain-containing protein [Azoarcus olearius]|uniref:FHA-domain containing protein n=1 Tax=Azoarcus sp. (strain BH72) TaxID=418699 RepID=A1KAU0_AZOSB|nr:FHA domain-containing protein [Azoarcus olearius]ANQ86489.1 FHA-domain-containing protein [Azoarcus olearius]CAL95946.1 FHA-domain containing protein [Azoarcus olearius]